MFRYIRWRIATLYVALILLLMGGLTIYLSHFMREVHLANLQAQLLTEARLIADGVGASLTSEEDAEVLGTQARHWAELLNVRVTIIGADGVVLGESHADRTRMDNHRNRPEVQRALTAGEGLSIRFSSTVGTEIIYAAVPIKRNGEVLGIARVALPLSQLERDVGHLRRTVLAVMLLTASLAVILAMFIAQRTVHPVHQLTQIAKRLAEGDLEARYWYASPDEMGQLARAFNQMADQLREKMSMLAGERSRLAAVLDHMADGVLITDRDERVQLINPAASRLLNTSEAAALGRSCAQVLRDHRLIELWQRCSQQEQEQIESVEIDRRGLFLRVIVTPLREAGQHGCLIILQDLTQMRRLETVRRDFISNISHELRTPLASLKALVDTLRDGALDDPPAAQRFLNRVEIEVDALTQMVQELLELSRIESGQVPLRLVATPVANVVLPSVERLHPQAERANLKITINLPDDLPPVLADAERVQQVVTNLVHNAIKFTPAGGQITIVAEPAKDEVVISVRDTGIGLSADDLPRIFERFYKADRARASGGTGLGLAIAKHIVQAHGGRIWAESIEGRGSTFYFTLPMSSP